MTFKELLHRRVPQFTGAYLVGGWGLVQFVSFLESRYAIHATWVDGVALGWLLLLPAVLVLAWNHGAPGPDPWTRPQIASLTVNVLVAVAVMGIFAFNSDVDASTKVVTVQDENGQSLTREVPNNAEDTTSVLIFFPDATEDHWLRRGMGTLLYIDLLQDLFIDSRSPYHNQDLARRLGAPSIFEIPRTIRRAIAERHHVEYYLTGTIDRIEPFEASFVVYETESAREVARQTFSGTPFSAADACTRWLREAIGLPKGHLRRNPDQPVADMITASLPALQAYSRAYDKTLVEADFSAGAAGFIEATKLDPTFALAQFQLFTISKITTAVSAEAADAARSSALTHLVRLPDRLQFLFKYFYYDNTMDVPKARRILELWAKLMPNDPLVYQLRAKFQQVLGEPKAAIASLNRALELFPGSSVTLTQLAQLYKKENQHEEAREVYRRLLELFPDDSSGYLALGDSFLSEGKFDLADEYYEQAVLLEPTNGRGEIGQALVMARRGKLDEALVRLEEIGARSTAAEDRGAALEERMRLLESRGRLQEAIEVFEQWTTVAKSATAYGEYMITRSEMHRLYAKAGRPEVAMSKLTALHDEVPAAVGSILGMGRARTALAAGDLERAREGIQALEEFVEKTGATALSYMVDRLEGGRLMALGSFKEALGRLERSMHQGETTPERLRELSEALRLNGRLEDSLSTAERALALDEADGASHLAAARTLRDLGKLAGARTRVNRAIELWGKADANFAPKTEALTLRDELNGS